ncbi:MAG: hypothetical protein AB9869_35005 [Verrucomicrobiia bacterium]
MSIFAKLFRHSRRDLSREVEQLLVGHFSAYWETHPSTVEQHQEVITLIRERVSMTAEDVLQAILDPRLPPLKTAGILDKIVDRVYGGNSTFFLKQLTRK